MAEKIPGALSLPLEERAALYALLDEYVKVTDALAIAQERQKEIRLALVARYFVSCKEGTATMPLEYGKVLKAGISITRSAKQEAIDAWKKTNTSNSLAVLLDEIITYKPSVSVTAWKALTPEQRLAFADIVVEKEGLPTIEIVTHRR